MKSPSDARCIGGAKLALSFQQRKSSLKVLAVVLLRAVIAFESGLNESVSVLIEFRRPQTIAAAKILRGFPIGVLIAAKRPGELHGKIRRTAFRGKLKDGNLQREAFLAPNGPLLVAAAVSLHLALAVLVTLLRSCCSQDWLLSNAQPHAKPIY